MIDNPLDERERPRNNLHLLDHISYLYGAGESIQADDLYGAGESIQADDPVKFLLKIRELIINSQSSSIEFHQMVDGIERYLMQNSSTGTTKTFDAILGLNGKQNFKERKTVTQFKYLRRSAHYIRAFCHASGDTWHEKKKDLFCTRDYLINHWYDFFKEMMLLLDRQDEIAGLFETIKEAWIRYPSKTEHCLTKIHLMLAIEADCVKKEGVYFDSFTHKKQKRDAILTKAYQNKNNVSHIEKNWLKNQVKIGFTNNNDLSAICKDVNLLDHYCYDLPDYTNTRKMIVNLK